MDPIVPSSPSVKTTTTTVTTMTNSHHPHMVYGPHGYPDGNHTRSPTFSLHSLWEPDSEDFYFTIASITILCITILLVCLCFCCLGKTKSLCLQLWNCCRRARPTEPEAIEMKAKPDENNNTETYRSGKEVPAAVLDFVGLFEERYYKVLDELEPREARMGPLPRHFGGDDYVDRLLRRMANRRHSAARREALMDNQSVAESQQAFTYTPSGQLFLNSGSCSYYSLPRCNYLPTADGGISIIGTGVSAVQGHGGRPILIVPPAQVGEESDIGDSASVDPAPNTGQSMEVQAVVEAAPAEAGTSEIAPAESGQEDNNKDN